MPYVLQGIRAYVIVYANMLGAFKLSKGRR